MKMVSYNAYTEGSRYCARFPGARQRLVGPLDLFLRFLMAQEPKILEQVNAKLLARMRNFTVKGRSPVSPGIVAEVIQEFPSAQKHRALFQAQFELQRKLLGVGEQVWIGQEAVEVPQTAFFRAVYVPQYLALKALIDVLGKAGAITLMKRCLDWVYMQGPSNPNWPETIEELRNGQVEGNLRGQGMDWIAAIVSEHEYRNKVTTCVIQKALAEYGDDELMEVVACYPDFTMFRKINSHFCLTRTKTLMNGGDCCDMCYHDDRYVLDFVHPSPDVFDAMPASETAAGE